MLPDYWIERPPLTLDASTQSAVAEVLSAMQAAGPNRPLDVNGLMRDYGDVTPWKFLCGVADRHRIAFHGTGDPTIESFEPRHPIDYAPFGDQKAVFATSDPIWAMFYAIVDRDRYDITLNNGCIILLDAEGRPTRATTSRSVAMRCRKARGEPGTSTSFRRMASWSSRPARMPAMSPASLSLRAPSR